MNEKTQSSTTPSSTTPSSTTPSSTTPSSTTQSKPKMFGIANMGNTCFLNVSLQILYQCPQMDKVLKECSVQEKRPEFIILDHWNAIKEGHKQIIVNPNKDPVMFPRGLLQAIRHVAKAKKNVT